MKLSVVPVLPACPSQPVYAAVPVPSVMLSCRSRVTCVGDGFGDDPPRVGCWGRRPAAGEDDAADRDRLVADPAGGEGRVCVCHLERRDPDPQPADPLRRDPVEGAGDPHRVGRFGDRFGPDVEVELGEDRVVGGDRGLLEVDRAEVSLVRGVDFPVPPPGQVEVERLET